MRKTTGALLAKMQSGGRVNSALTHSQVLPWQPTRVLGARHRLLAHEAHICRAFAFAVCSTSTYPCGGMAMRALFVLALSASGALAEVEEVTSQAQFQKILSNNAAVAVDFFSTTCGPCIMIAPRYKEVRVWPLCSALLPR